MAEYVPLLTVYHWYVGVPLPPVNVVVNAAIEPPSQMDCVGIGCTLKVGSFITVNVATVDEMSEQPLPAPKLMVQ